MLHEPSAERALAQFRSETDEIREAPEPLTARLTVLSLTGLLAATLTVAGFAQVDRVVTSERGRIVSTAPMKTFQALDASIIKTIDVREGDQVGRGQLLATLDPTFAAADVNQLRQQIASLDAQIARAEAEIAGRDPPPSDGAAGEARYRDLQAALFRQRQGQYRAQLASFDEKISQVGATLHRLENEQARLAERQEIADKIKDMRQQLLEKQAGSLLNLLIASDARLELVRTAENGRNALVEARHQLAALQADRSAFVEQWATGISQELVTARNTRDAALSQLRKADRKEELIRLAAPEDGVVLSMARLSVGSVLREGEQLMTLMPLSAPVEAEVHVVARNVGFVRPGDRATVKVDAFNFAEHGSAEGRIRWISENAFTIDDDGKPVEAYYKARVAIERMSFAHVPPGFRLIPGMTLVSDIHVGTRSVLAYVVGGALRGAGEAMREP